MTLIVTYSIHRSDFAYGKRWFHMAFELLKFLKDERKLQLEQQVVVIS